MFLQFYRFRRFRKGIERRFAILEIQHDGIVVVLVVHASEAWILVQHVLLGFYSVVRDQSAFQSEPSAVLEAADLGIRVFQKLSVAVLFLSGLNVELSFKFLGRSKRSDSWLIAFYCCKNNLFFLFLSA